MVFMAHFSSTSSCGSAVCCNSLSHYTAPTTWNCNLRRGQEEDGCRIQIAGVVALVGSAVLATLGCSLLCAGAPLKGMVLVIAGTIGFLAGRDVSVYGKNLAHFMSGSNQQRGDVKSRKDLSEFLAKGTTPFGQIFAANYVAGLSD